MKTAIYVLGVFALAYGAARVAGLVLRIRNLDSAVRDKRERDEWMRAREVHGRRASDAGRPAMNVRPARADEPRKLSTRAGMVKKENA